MTDSLEANRVAPMPVATIEFWQRFIHEWAERKGWNQNLEERSFGDWMALFVSEISEAYEDYRNHYGPTEIYYELGDNRYTRAQIDEMLNPAINLANAKPCGIPIEIADLAIRMLHFCAHYGIDLNAMIALKMQYNETRAHRHGGKKV